MTGNGLVKRFAVCEATEMERLSPPVLIKIGSKIVVTMFTLALSEFCLR